MRFHGRAWQPLRSADQGSPGLLPLSRSRNGSRWNDEAVAGWTRVWPTHRPRLVDAGRPVTDLLRLQALLEEMKISQNQAHVNAQWAWKQLAAEVGVSELPFAAMARDLDPAIPDWDANDVMSRVLANHSALREREMEVDGARLAVARARSEAVPNVTVSTGYINDAINQTAGWSVGVGVPLPIWDRKQGEIQSAQARLAHAQAAVQTTSTQLMRQTAEALSRYQAIRQQVEKLDREVLPLLKKSFDLLEKSYQAGGQVSFSDLLMTEQSYFATRLSLASARHNLWLAIADVQGLLQQGLD